MSVLVLLPEIAKSVRRLLGRRVYVLQVLASIFMVSGFNGFSTFSAKYMETQFRTSASKASTFAGWSVKRGCVPRCVTILIHRTPSMVHGATICNLQFLNKRI